MCVQVRPDQAGQRALGDRDNHSNLVVSPRTFIVAVASSFSWGRSPFS